MKYHNITKADMLNGEGLRVVLWVSGCSHHCPACQNAFTWNENDGVDFDDNAINEKSKIFRESMRIEEEEEENTEANNSFGTKQNEIEENRTKDNGLPR